MKNVGFLKTRRLLVRPKIEYHQVTAVAFEQPHKPNRNSTVSFWTDDSFWRSLIFSRTFSL